MWSGPLFPTLQAISLRCPLGNRMQIRKAVTAMQVAVFHPGVQHSWQTVLALQDLGRLQWYATSIFRRADRFPFTLENLLPGALGRATRREFSRFDFPQLADARIITPGSTAEWIERLTARAGFLGPSRRINDLGNDLFARALEREIRTDIPYAVWGYNSASQRVFATAKACGRLAILDRTIGDWRYFNHQLEIIRQTHADWFIPGVEPQNAQRIARDDAEYSLADVILCGSEFAAATVRQFAEGQVIAEKLRVLPYCFDEALFGNMPAPAPVPKSGPVKFLFTGLAGLRKGFHHVLEAIAQLPRSDAELTVVGQLSIPDAIFARYADRVTYRRTVPRSEMPAIMADHHALLFPSYFEGSALTLVEALASGLALIQTPQSGNGVTPDTGICLAKPGTSELLGAMRQMIDDRDRLDAMRVAAQHEAQRYRFAQYRQGISQLLADLAC